MKKYWWLIAAGIVLSAGLISWNIKTTSKPAETASAVTEIKWVSYQEAVKLNKKKKKKYLVDVYTDWCGWCKKMDKQTFGDPAVIKYVNDNYIAVKLNAESDSAATYQGQTVTEAQLAVQIFRASGYPTTVVLEEDQNLLLSQPGFVDATNMDKVLHFYGANAYKNQTWEQFLSTYVKE